MKPPRTETGEIDHSKAEFPLFDLIMKKLQLEVLYEEESGAIRVFSTLPATRKSSTIRDVSRMKKETLMQICGASAKMLLSLEPDNENTFAISDVREAIALAASGRRSATALAIGLMAAIIVMPIPFGNLLPAVALVFIGLGLVFRDGLAVILGLLMSCVALAATTGLLLMGWARRSQRL